MGNVLRNEQFLSAPRFSFEDLEDRARRIIADAETRAAQIVATAQAKARDLTEPAARSRDARRQQGYEAGLEEGRRAGQEQAKREARATAVKEAKAELAEVIQALNAGLAEFDAKKHHLLATAESGLLELALAIAQRVCRLVATRTPDVARTQARALLELVTHEADVELRLNPADCEPLEEVAADLAAQATSLTHVRVIPDPSVEKGGCIVQSAAGEIDGQLSTQLDRLATALGIAQLPETPASPTDDAPAADAS